MVACTNSSKETATQTVAQPTVDTTGFAQYQLWKSQHELANPQEYQQEQHQPQQVAAASQVKIAHVPVERRANTS
ncbi:MAG: hypothetical protein C4329_14970, partial [Chitinophagaceae bacterium]